MSEITAKAAAKLDEFERDKDPFCIQAAADLLESANLDEEPDALKWLVLRRETLEAWLGLLALIDRHLDSSFDPGRAPATGVTPRGYSGFEYPPGIRPDAIPDSRARQAYAAALEENRAYAHYHRLQTWLRRFDQQLSPKVKHFIRMRYTTVPAEQRELSELVRKLIVNQQRADALLRATTPRQ